MGLGHEQVRSPWDWGPQDLMNVALTHGFYQAADGTTWEFTEGSSNVIVHYPPNPETKYRARKVIQMPRTPLDLIEGGVAQGSENEVRRQRAEAEVLYREFLEARRSALTPGQAGYQRVTKLDAWARRMSDADSE